MKNLMSKNQKHRRPTHPGEILREDVLPELGISQAAFAASLGVSRKTINEILNERASITVDTAHRLARALGTTPELWIRLQQAVALFDAAAKNKKDYARIKPVAA